MTQDYPQQVKQAYLNLSNQAETTRSGWHDSVSQRFFNDYMNRYKDDTDRYISELSNTLTAIERCKNDMAALM